MDGSYIESSKAPRPGKKPTTKRGEVSQRLVAGLTTGKVLRVQPEAGQTVRGVKVSLSRAAKNLGRTIETWDIEGIVYAELVEG